MDIFRRYCHHGWMLGRWFPSVRSSLACMSFRRPVNLIPSFPWIAPHALIPGAIQGKEGIKFCCVSTSGHPAQVQAIKFQREFRQRGLLRQEQRYQRIQGTDNDYCVRCNLRCLAERFRDFCFYLSTWYTYFDNPCFYERVQHGSALVNSTGIDSLCKSFKRNWFQQNYPKCRRNRICTH